MWSHWIVIESWVIFYYKNIIYDISEIENKSELNWNISFYYNWPSATSCITFLITSSTSNVGTQNGRIKQHMYVLVYMYFYPF